MQAVLAAEKVFDLSEEKRVDVTALTSVIGELEFRKGVTVRPAGELTAEANGNGESDEVEQGFSDEDDAPYWWPSMATALPSLTNSEDGEHLSLVEARGSLSLEHDTDSTPSQAKDTDMLVQKVGKFLSRVSETNSLRLPHHDCVDLLFVGC